MLLFYRGYVATITTDVEADLICGECVVKHDLTLKFHAFTPDFIRRVFHAAVDLYLLEEIRIDAA